MTVRPCGCERAECAQCAPLVALAEELRREFAGTRADARVPTPEIVWWRAQMRAREDAARRAARPILFTEALAMAALIGLLVSIAGRLTIPALVSLDLRSLAGGLPLAPLAIAAASCLVLASAALYLALSRD